MKQPRSAVVFVRDLRLPTRIGIYPDEQRRHQWVAVDLELGVCWFAPVPRGQGVAGSVDYAAAANTVRQVVRRGHYPLVESLAQALVEALLALDNVGWTRVRVAKLGCVDGAKSAGVELRVEQCAERMLERAQPQPLSVAAGDQREPVVVLGGGVAGVTALLWVHRLGHRGLLIDAGPTLGGQLHRVHRPMPDLAGLPPMTGPAYCRGLVGQLHAAARWCKAQVQSISVEGERVVVGCADGRVVSARAAIIATGIRRRQLAVAGAERLIGRGLLGTASEDLPALAGRVAVVIGGGDAACENALILAEAGASVSLLHRGTALSCRREFRDRVARSAIDVRLRTTVIAFVGDERLTAVICDGPGGREEITAAAALVRIGWLPNTSFVPKPWCDARGFVQVERGGQVIGERRVFAAGDVVGPRCFSVAYAAGSAAEAARSACAVVERSS